MGLQDSLSSGAWQMHATLHWLKSSMSNHLSEKGFRSIERLRNQRLDTNAPSSGNQTISRLATSDTGYEPAVSRRCRAETTDAGSGRCAAHQCQVLPLPRRPLHTHGASITAEQQQTGTGCGQRVCHAFVSGCVPATCPMGRQRVTQYGGAGGAVRGGNKAIQASNQQRQPLMLHWPHPCTALRPSLRARCPCCSSAVLLEPVQYS